LQSLSGNFNDFLQLLMTQLQNQDPTSPLDTNEFTSQLVQFASVEQQINTNSSLTQLIQLTQSGELLQAGSVVGHQVRIQSDHIPLQGGTGQVQFTAPTAEPAAIAIYSDSGQKIREVAVNASAGTNTWTWDGTDDAGNTVPDGSYRIAVIGANTDGSTSALPFTVTGTATGVQTASSGNGVQLQLGALSVDFSAVRSFVN
jgi:flagellar basal-body rod modification protein FlgD